jgi:hypothetical protein
VSIAFLIFLILVALYFVRNWLGRWLSNKYLGSLLALVIVVTGLVLAFEIASYFFVFILNTDPAATGYFLGTLQGNMYFAATIAFVLRLIWDFLHSPIKENVDPNG